MKIRIREDASRIYARRFKDRMIPNHEWLDKLQQIEGKVLEVETKYLFKDQYNTAPIPGVSDNGLRVMEESVTEVIDDERPGKVRCNWCGKIGTNNGVLFCEHCKKSGYLEAF